MARHGSHTQSWPAGSRPRPLGEVKIIIHKMVVAVVLVIKMVVIRIVVMIMIRGADDKNDQGGRTLISGERVQLNTGLRGHTDPNTVFKVMIILVMQMMI